jgi:hypothetical protein
LALSIPFDKCENNADIAELDEGKRDFSQQLHGEVTEKGLGTRGWGLEIREEDKTSPT